MGSFEEYPASMERLSLEVKGMMLRSGPSVRGMTLLCGEKSGFTKSIASRGEAIRGKL